MNGDMFEPFVEDVPADEVEDEKNDIDVHHLLPPFSVNDLEERNCSVEEHD
jgi:hypothetical protein